MAVNFRQFIEGLRIVAKTASTADTKGDLDVTSSTGKLNFHNGTTASPVVTEAHTATLTNKTLSGNTAVTLISGSGTLTLNTTGTVTVPNATDTLVGKATTDTLTNKTLTSPVINSPTGIVKGDVGLGNVDNTSDSTKNSASVTLTNKTLDTTNTVTLKDTLFGIVDDGDTSKVARFQASGISTSTTRTMTIPDADLTIVGTATTQTLTNKTLSGNTAVTLISGSGTLTLPTSGTITVPNATDTLVGKATTDTLTNKTLTTPTMTGPIVTTSAMDLQVGQIAFPATQNASAGANTLDDYEEGTWTATFTCGTSGTATVSGSNNTGAYTKVGRKVTLTGYIAASAVSTPIGTFKIGGLPFAVADLSQSAGRASVSIWADSLSASAITMIMGFAEEATSSIQLSTYSAGSNSGAAFAQLVQSSSAFILNISYFTT